MSGELWPTAKRGKRTILGNDSENRDTIIVQLEPTGPGGFHDDTRWMDPSSWSLMRRAVRRADVGAEPARPQERRKFRSCVQAAAIARYTEAGTGGSCAEGGANEYSEAAGDCATAAGSRCSEAVGECADTADNECAAECVSADCAGADLRTCADATCTDIDAGHVYASGRERATQWVDDDCACAIGPCTGTGPVCEQAGSESSTDGSADTAVDTCADGADWTDFAVRHYRRDFGWAAGDGTEFASDYNHAAALHQV